VIKKVIKSFIQPAPGRQQTLSKQAFHHIWVDPQVRDALQFFWIEDLETKKIATLRQRIKPILTYEEHLIYI
jgi:hypothetical protein